MKIVNASVFKADRPWGAIDLAEMNGVTIRVHWTDAPYHWHVNTGEEVFAVLDGVVDMHVRQGQEEQVFRLEAGHVFVAHVGCAHYADPIGEARILVVEHAGSE